MTRIFVDTNILFSAALKEGTRISSLWDLPDVQLVISEYVRSEAIRNIMKKRPLAASRLTELVSRMEISTANIALKDNYGLPDKDRPILEAAVASGCSVLITGDKNDFLHLIEIEIEGIQITTVRAYLESRAK